jgi:acyl-CoA synthetase (AMP-forming)/AMP-acid ligase II
MDTPLPNRHLDPKARAAVAGRMAEAQAKFARLTDRLVVDAAETRAVRAEIHACRDWLWPRRQWQREIHWRRPRGCGAPPIPPPLPEADVLAGRSLRTHALAVLLQTGGGELPLPEIHTLLHRRGFAVAGPNPVKRLADALGYEHRKGRARRTRRGWYELGELSPRRRRALAKLPPGGGHPRGTRPGSVPPWLRDRSPAPEGSLTTAPAASEDAAMSETDMDLLSAYAASQGDKPAVIDDRPGQAATAWTFADLNREANRLAHLLLGLGVGRDTKVVWCGQNSIPIFALSNAARRIGAVAVPLNYRLAADEAAYVIDNSDAEVVYVDAEFARLIDEVRERTPKVRHVLIYDGDGTFERDLAAQPDSDPPSEDADVGAATMIYTSGTTGKPKGALRRGRNISQAAALIAHIGYRTDDVYLTTGPLYHSGPGGFAGVAHALGNTVIVQRRFDPEDWLRLVDTYRVTTTFSAPTPIRMVCSLPDDIKARYDRSSMKRLIANAAPWSFALKQMYLADFPQDSLWEVYGSTELSVDTVLAPEDQLRKPGSCGLPAPGMEIKLFDDDGVEVTEPGVPGELFVRSEALFDTYYKAEDKYEEDRRGDFHTVGDIAYRDDEGYYYICDRKKDMIISGGMNIYPAEIEAALEQHPGVFDVAVFGIPSEAWGEAVHAVVVRAPGHESLAQADVVDFAREHLAGYKIPRSVTFAAELPRTGSGKLLKRELCAPYWQGRQTKVG